MKKKDPINGDLVIADANVLSDQNFSRSVILLAEHNQKGSLGFILNKKLNMTLKDILPSSDCNFKVYYGGPVEAENLYFIHNIPDVIKNSIEISEGIFWGGDFEAIIQLLIEKKIKRTNIRFFLGYTGWETDQLEYEIETESWLVKENIYGKKLLQETPSYLWKELMMSLGDKYIIWSNAPEDPVLN